MDSLSTHQSFGSHSQVPNSLPSLSCPSEPPDVGNWFSSYKYSSPAPDSNFGLEESASRGTESQRGDEEDHDANFVKVKTRDEAVAQENKSLDSFSSQSLLSEPPDIRNWFSSYNYESFVPDTYSMFKDDDSQENEYEEEERVDFKSINEAEDLSENVHPEGNVEHKSSSDENKRGDGSDETNRSLASSSTSHLEKILQPCKQDKAMQHNYDPAKYGATIGLNHRSPACSREAQIMSFDVKKCPDYTTEEMVQKNGMGEAKSKSKTQHDKVEMNSSLGKSILARSPTCTINKENDGFVLARRDRYPKANDENSNSWKKSENLSPLQCSTNTGTVPLACQKQAATKRKALTDATNVLQSNGLEITGKWRCPQKGKPYVGPALKQLRLEKWVHRV